MLTIHGKPSTGNNEGGRLFGAPEDLPEILELNRSQRFPGKGLSR
jgi:hypothetical protein